MIHKIIFGEKCKVISYVCNTIIFCFGKKFKNWTTYFLYVSNWICTGLYPSYWCFLSLMMFSLTFFCNASWQWCKHVCSRPWSTFTIFERFLPLPLCMSLAGQSTQRSSSNPSVRWKSSLPSAEGSRCMPRLCYLKYLGSLDPVRCHFGGFFLVNSSAGVSELPYPENCNL